MEEKHREAAVQPPSNVDSPASESTSSRRRSGGLKRKVNALSASNSAPTPSKRVTREKALPAHPSPVHNGPLTRARQIPSNHATAAASASVARGGGFAAGAAKHAVTSEAFGRESGARVEDIKKESEWQALEAAIETEFEAIRSRGANAHVVPTHCGWFLWTDIHPIEKNALPSFFNGKTDNRTPDIYMEIRNWIMKKFHANPNAQIELKDLSELNVGDLDSRQEVMEFLDHWGLINFHPFPSMANAVVSTDDGAAEKQSLVEQFYHFENVQLCPHVVPKTSLMTQDMPSGLFPESTFAEELVKQEGPAVEYHCNSCSADCSRRRYHCQKQADFDLCTDCFSNGKFGSGMSSTDFILMEPAEVQGVSGGKWTDQETLLLLEALELYKENWNEIAEHVATKTKAQCILHFVQMPIEEAFSESDVDANCKETSDPAATKNLSSIVKDASETLEHNTGNNDGQVLTPCDETSNDEDANKEKVDQETTMPENGSHEKINEGTCKLENAAEVKLGQEAGDSFVLKALGEAFEAIGYSPGPGCPSSFAEVGNPVMALGGFLARLVGSDMAVASAHSSLTSISSNSPSVELAARHCFLVEDPPDDKKGSSSFERDSKMDVGQDESEKQDKYVLPAKDISNSHNDRTIANDALEDNGQLTSTDGETSKEPAALKEQVVANHEKIVLDNCKSPANSKLSSDCTGRYSDGSTSKAEETSIKELCQPAEKTKDECVVSDSLCSEKNEFEQSVVSNKVGEKPKSAQAPTDIELVSDYLPSDKNKPKKSQSKNPAGECTETMEPVMNVDAVPNSLPSENNESERKDVDATSALDQNEPSHPVTSKSGAENGKSTGEDHTENGRKMEDNITNAKRCNKFEKLKCAAISTLAAAAVKAKLLANQEEDQVRQLATLLIEKQLHKLETKLAFFNDMDHVVMRVREHLDRSRQKLYHERAMIIASRLGIPPSSRGLPPSLPTNRIPMNFANSVPRPPINMNPQRLPISRSMGTLATTLSNSLSSATATGNPVQPSTQENVSSVETK